MGGMGGGPQMFFSMGGMPGGMGGMPGMGGMGGMGGGRPVERCNVIKNGVNVIVQNLRSAAQHNGKQGVIESYDPRKERYTVQLQTQEVIALKTSNFQQIVEGVRITGLGSKPQLNGTEGIIVGWNLSNSRYTVQNQFGEAMALQPKNVVVPNGTRVMIQNLNAAQYNGKWGEVLEFAPVTGRYQVKIDKNQVLALKLENVKA